MIMQGFMSQERKDVQPNLGLGNVQMPEIKKPTMLKQTPSKIEWGKGIGGQSADFGRMGAQFQNAIEQLNTSQRHSTDFGSEQTKMLAEQDRGMYDEDGLMNAISSLFR